MGRMDSKADEPSLIALEVESEAEYEDGVVEIRIPDLE